MVKLYIVSQFLSMGHFVYISLDSSFIWVGFFLLMWPLYSLMSYKILRYIIFIYEKKSYFTFAIAYFVKTLF